MNEETERERKARREREKGPEREGDSGGEEDGKKKKEKACGAVMKGKREKTPAARSLASKEKEKEKKRSQLWPFDAFRSLRLLRSETQNPTAHPQTGASNETFVLACEF